MTLSFIRCFFILISGVVGYYVGILVELQTLPADEINMPLQGAQIGAVGGLVLIFLESQLQRVSVRGLSSLVFGLVLGVLMAKIMSSIIALLPLDSFLLSITEIVLILVFSYFGAVMALRGKDEFNIIVPYVRFRRQDIRDDVILIDTSVVIDGRISDIYKTNFLSGRLVVPRFVLKELQALADSSDDLKRQKGRRGLELLRTMQDDPKLEILIHEDEIGGDQDVDAKLIKLAKLMEASICTTDFNLGRIASLQGITILNINELISAAKSVLFAGDQVDVYLVKEGKESNQAVGYLEDGTMIVVNDAKDNIGKTVKVNVESVLQTQAGKMIFANRAK